MCSDQSMLWSVVVGVLFIYADAQESNGPVIDSPPNNEIILQSGQNYTLFCRGKRPVKFEQQEIPEENDGQFYKEYRNSSSEAQSEFWAAVDLFNVDRFAVGYYACFDDEVDRTTILKLIEEEPQNTEHVTYTYVYVNDSYLAAPVSEIVRVKIGSKFVIECKPTTPDINVTLTLDNEHIESDLYYYSPKVGFYVDSHVVSISYGGLNPFNCTFVKKGRTQCKDVLVHTFLAVNTPRPNVSGENSDFLDGETFIINCTVPKPRDLPVDLQWKIPDTADIAKIHYSSNSDKILHEILYKNITVVNASKNEAGYYVCIRNSDEATSSNFTKIYLEKPVLDVERRNILKTSINTTNRKFYRLVAIVKHAYPKPMFTVFRGNRSLKHDGIKYKELMQDSSHYTFTILNLSPEDTGTYYVEYSNSYKEQKLKGSFEFIIEATGPPRINQPAIPEKTYLKGTFASLQCEAVGVPPPTFTWTFTDETGAFSALNKQSHHVVIEDKVLTEYKSSSRLTIPVNLSGNITCTASNVDGIDTVVQTILVYEQSGGFGIKNENTWYSEGDKVLLQCLASLYDFFNATWLDKNFHEISNVQLTRNQLSIIAELLMDPIAVEQEGPYYCMGTRFNGSTDFANITITVASKRSPTFLGAEEESQSVNAFDTVNISCIAEAVPPPKIEWYKDDAPLVFDDNKIKNITREMNLTMINSTIIIYPMQADYAGVYECIMRNKDNERIKTYELIMNDTTTPQITLYTSLAAVLFLFLILLVLYLVWMVKKEKQFRKELAAAGLLYFKEGVSKSINPDLGIDEQAELLPYDERFEFPVERLIIGKQLGAGAFGVVYKAEARGIVNAEQSTTVAVKMVKKTADNMYIKALASELKIMVHLGKHVNIVNLLGACTKKVGKRELIVIVEYCKFGNIHNYLQRHQEVFIDQLNDNAEKTLGRVNKGYSSSSGNTGMTSDYFGSNHTQETDNTFLNTANTNRSGRKDNQNLKEYQNKQVDMEKVSDTGYVQPEWRSNYESDYSYDGRSPRPLCSRDLLAWSFQVARGMEYLASKKILHGDLAARNILLAEDNVVKICDFGLARSIYKNDEYQKKENSPLPVKWLAIECVTNGIFSTQSDVWSFGIVLWEIFTLAKTPYPNISPSALLQKLQDGYRLEKPVYANDRLYDVMRECWNEKPPARPSFTRLQEILGSFLEDHVRNHYVDLNATYIDMNQKQQGEEDYLAMVTAPDYNNLVTPSPCHHYANDDATRFFPGTPVQQQLQHDDEGYLQMSPASRQTLFNARPQGTKFDFDARKLTPRVSEANSYGSESTPMLTLNNLPRSGSESDHEGNASPYMNMCPKISEEKDDDVFSTKENNAKNVQPIISVDNPTYITLGDEKKPQKFANNYTNLTVPNGLVK